MMSDEELMLKFQNGEPTAFDVLFEKYRSAVFNFIYRMLNRDKESAEDLLHEVFVKMTLGKASYEPKAKFITWLFSIARNHCLNHIKSKHYAQTYRTISMDATDTTGRTTAEKLASQSSSTGPDNSLEYAELLENVIGALPEKYREIFLLHAVEGFTHEEIAQMLKSNPATVRSEYHRGKMLIRQKMSAPDASTWRYQS